MTLFQLTYEEALADLADIVKEKGDDYVYVKAPDEDHCVYFADGQPSCIIGHLLARHGVGPSSSPENEPWNSSSCFALNGTIIDADDRTIYLLSRVQALQDHSQPWGEALRRGVRQTEVEYGVTV